MPMRKTNPRYRTKNQMIEDVLFAILSYRSGKLHYGGAHNIVFGLTHEWTQYNGLYEGNPLWSEKATEVYLSLPKGSAPSQFFREEHVLPRKLLIAQLFSREDLTFEAVKTYVQEHLISVILTIEENKEMDRDYRSSMPEGEFRLWNRYIEKKIKVNRMEWKRKGRSLYLESFSPYDMEAELGEILH